MIESTLTLESAFYSETVPAGEGWIREIKAGQTFRIVDLHGNQAVAAHKHPALLGKIQRHHRDTLPVDVEPDVELGPVRQREHPHAVAPTLAAVVEPPWLGALALWIPTVLGVPERKDTFLGPGSFLVAAGASECGIESEVVERLAELLRVLTAAEIERSIIVVARHRVRRRRLPIVQSNADE